MTPIVVPVEYPMNYSWNETSDRITRNDSKGIGDENVFDLLEVRIIFIILYVLVFCCCVFGNLLVILVVMLSRRLKSAEFFLGNLAIADLCVGIFCILQTISSYMTSTWVFGDFFCKMNYFIHSLSCTASIFILVVISVERYLAIIHPIRFRQIMTQRRLKVVITLIWVISTAYSSPRFIFAKTVSHSIKGDVQVICIISRETYNSELFDMINFVLLYLLPLGIMIVLYTLIAIRLRNSAQAYMSIKKCKRINGSLKKPFNQIEGSVVRVKLQKSSTSKRQLSIGATGNPVENCACSNWSVTDHISCRNVLRARRRVIKMLVLVVLTFAICNIPFHARKMLQYWSRSYDVLSNFSSLLTPLTFLLTYCNSAINPLLYAFISRNFRKGMKEISLYKFGFGHSKKTSSAESY